MRKQLFGYTPTQCEYQQYVPFIAVVEADDNTIVFSVRAPDGDINEIALPRAVAAELGAALMADARQQQGAGGPAAIHTDKTTR